LFREAISRALAGHRLADDLRETVRGQNFVVVIKLDLFTANFLDADFDLDYLKKIELKVLQSRLGWDWLSLRDPLRSRDFPNGTLHEPFHLLSIQHLRSP